MNAHDIVIRKATDLDATAIALLGRITFDDTFGSLFTYREEFLQYLDATFSVEKITSSLKKEENIYWIALHRNLPVGYAKLKINSSIDSENLERNSQAQLQKIYVLRDFQSFKIGAQFLQLVLDEIRHKHINNLWLVALSSNTKALKFYNRHAFKFYKKHYFSIGSNDFEFDVLQKVTHEGN